MESQTRSSKRAPRETRHPFLPTTLCQPPFANHPSPTLCQLFLPTFSANPSPTPPFRGPQAPDLTLETRVNGFFNGFFKFLGVLHPKIPPRASQALACECAHVESKPWEVGAEDPVKDIQRCSLSLQEFVYRTFRPCPRQSFVRVARLRNEVGTKDFLRGTNFLTEKMLRNFPQHV